MIELKLKTLGGLAIQINGQPLALRNRKVLALLVYLALHRDQAFTRTHLQNLLWSESDEKRGRASLRQALTQLQRAIPNSLSLDGQTIALSAACHIQIDVEQLSQDVALYEGLFLQGFTLKQANGWDEWLFTQRETIDAQFLAELENHGKRALQADNFAAAISAFQRALTVDNWRETSHRLLMEAFWRSGDRAAALAQFEQCRQVLDAELGVAVSVQTQALADRIATSDNLRNGNLPSADGRAFLGRERELAEIGRMLQTPDCRLVTMTGLGGIGKTSLALAVGRQQQAHFADGVWLIDLVGVESDNLLPTILEALDIPASGRGTPRRWLFSHLKTSKRLLILDNFEQLLAQTELVQAILAAAPHVKLLVTSRERLNLQAEWSYTVSGLISASNGRDGDNVAVQLFIDHAARIRHGFAPSAADLAHIRHICHMVEGMPLAVQLAAAWMRVLSVEDVSAEIEQNLSFLQATQPNIPQRQQSLTAIFEYAYARLSAEAQRTLRQLSLLHGDFDREAAAQIAQANLFALTQLVDQTLIERTAGNRYRLHQRVRQFAAERLAEHATEKASAQARHSDYVADLLQRMLPQLKNENQRGTLAILGVEMDNVLAMWDIWLQTRQFDTLLVCEETIYYFYRLQERWHDLNRLFERTLAVVQPFGPRQPQLLATLQLRLAASYAALSLIASATAMLETAAPVFEQRRDGARLTQLCEVRAIVAQMQGDFALAAELGQQAVVGWLEIGRIFESAYTWSCLGNIAYSASQFADAQTAYEHALAIYEQVGDVSSAALMQHNLAFVAEAQGDLSAAMGWLALSDRGFAQTNTLRRRFTSIESLNLYSIFSQLPLPEEAEAVLTEWLLIVQADENRIDELFARGALGALKARRGQFDAAAQAYTAAQQLAQQLGLDWALLFLQVCQTDLAQRRDDRAATVACLHTLLAHTNEATYPFVLPYCVQVLLAVHNGAGALAVGLWLEANAVPIEAQWLAAAGEGVSAETHAQLTSNAPNNTLPNLLSYVGSQLGSVANSLV